MAQCENCGASLRPGLKRCLKCGTVLTESVPAAPAAPTGPPAQDPSTGQTPREWRDVRDLHINVNITPGDLSRPSGPQQPYATGGGTPPGPHPGMGTPFPPGATGGFPTSATSAGPVAVKRHRGGTILVLALLAAGITLFMMTVERRPTPAVWFIPFLPALIAWLMGVRDGREMKNGSRDPAGQGVTKVGKVIALINLLLLLYLIIGGFIVEQ